MDPHAFGRGLIVAGLGLIVVGALVLAAGRLPWLGRLPGDLWIQRKTVTLFLPLTTCLLLSVLLSLLAWLFWRR